MFSGLLHPTAGKRMSWVMFPGKGNAQIQKQFTMVMGHRPCYGGTYSLGSCLLNKEIFEIRIPILKTTGKELDSIKLREIEDSA